MQGHNSKDKKRLKVFHDAYFYEKTLKNETRMNRPMNHEIEYKRKKKRKKREDKTIIQSKSILSNLHKNRTEREIKSEI